MNNLVWLVCSVTDGVRAGYRLAGGRSEMTASLKARPRNLDCTLQGWEGTQWALRQ